ncbi:hypothetical protein LA080_012005 [Diaporthe eres]|nr:hypothetical protein LA080_012005 [Diaporthe eres]
MIFNRFAVLSSLLAATALAVPFVAEDFTYNCNFQPSSDNQCFLSTKGLFTWEGRSNQGCAFTSGITYYYSLPANAQSYANFAKVGTGFNAFHNYNVFKDNQHVMYTAGNGAVCKSIYYSLMA